MDLANTLSKKILLYSLPLCGLLSLSFEQLRSQNLDVPYVPTPQAVVERMLDLANVQPCDYIIDLGSGDGRIVIAAAKRGASGHGIDLDPQRIAEARENAMESGMNNRIMFKEQNIFETDFSRASVITMYLLPSVNRKLRPQLLKELEPGTRIVSHSFHMGEWKPDREVTVQDESGSPHEIYFWVIPAKAEGNWTWSANGTNFNMNIRQNFQELYVNLSDNHNSVYEVDDALLQGKRMVLRVTKGSKKYIFSGKINGNSITGVMQEHNREENTVGSWQAVSQPSSSR